VFAFIIVHNDACHLVVKYKLPIADKLHSLAYISAAESVGVSSTTFT